MDMTVDRAVISLYMTMVEADTLADLLDRADREAFPMAPGYAKTLWNAINEARGGEVTEGDL